MKLWTITTDDGDGVNTRIFVTKDEAETAFAETVERFWLEFVGGDDPCPEDREDALSQLVDMAGFMDGVWLDEHELAIADHKAALGQLLEQVYQMQGMFLDEDGAIARAVADAEEALA